MSKTMEDYGMLDKNGKPTKNAEKIYIDHCEEIAMTGGSDSLGFSCVKREPDPNAKYIDLNDKKLYKSFHDNWVQGIYADSLKMINLESNISLPIFDPLALAAKIDGLNPPKLGFEGTLPILAATAILPPPASITYALGICKVDPIKIPDLIPKVLSIINPVPIPPIPQLPLPSLEFPNISYDIPDYNLLDMKKRIFMAIPTAFLELFKTFSTPDFILNFASQGPIVAFSAACKALNKALPPQPGENSTSSEIYQAGLAATLAKPLAITTLGSVIGSAEGGVTGGAGYISPDPTKFDTAETAEPPEEDMKEPITFSMLFFPAKRRSERLRSKDQIRLIVLHSTEGPTAKSAANTFFSEHASASAHVIVGNDANYRCVEDLRMAWAAEEANAVGLHVEIAGFAKWTRDEWIQNAALENAASIVGEWSAKYDIPLDYIEGSSLRETSIKGVTTHAAVVREFKIGNHWDPGPQFPIDFVLEQAKPYRAYVLKNM